MGTDGEVSGEIIVSSAECTPVDVHRVSNSVAARILKNV